MRIFAERDRLKGAADDAGHSRESGAESKHQHEQQLHAIAEHREHVAVVDAGADHDADPGAIEREPHADTDENGGGENDEPHQRILEKHRFARLI